LEVSVRAFIALFVLVFLCAACGGLEDNPILFKFVTSGQNPDDAPIITRTIQGLALKPATPSDAKIFRDAQNNALVEWKRRGRINYHWRDRAGVPISEESEYYEVEVYNGGNVANTYRVPIALAQPIQWSPAFGNPGSQLTFATDGSGTVTRTTFTDGLINVIVSKQQIVGNFVFEFETYADASSGVYDGPDLVSAQSAVAPSVSAVASLIGSAGASHYFDISRAVGLPITTHFAAGDRYAISYVNGTATFFKNPATNQSPFLDSQAAAQTYAPYQIQLNFGPAGWIEGLKNPKLLRFDTPDWTYTADMQTVDGLTPGNSIHLKIYQVSAVAGRGLPLDVTL
jgi:hypothetical protein